MLDRPKRATRTRTDHDHLEAADSRYCTYCNNKSEAFKNHDPSFSKTPGKADQSRRKKNDGSGSVLPRAFLRAFFLTTRVRCANKVSFSRPRSRRVDWHSFQKYEDEVQDLATKFVV